MLSCFHSNLALSGYSGNFFRQVPRQRKKNPPPSLFTYRIHPTMASDFYLQGLVSYLSAISLFLFVPLCVILCLSSFLQLFPSQSLSHSFYLRLYLCNTKSLSCTIYIPLNVFPPLSLPLSISLPL